MIDIDQFAQCRYLLIAPEGIEIRCVVRSAGTDAPS